MLSLLSGCDGCGMWPIRGMAYEVPCFARGFKFDAVVMGI